LIKPIKSKKILKLLGIVGGGEKKIVEIKEKKSIGFAPRYDF